ncbi:MAG: HEAT repeat domain-containing protein [bacterium]|nr:HEAT repeat domain-containing protein [bacterium]
MKILLAAAIIIFAFILFRIIKYRGGKNQLNILLEEIKKSLPLALVEGDFRKNPYLHGYIDSFEISIRRFYSKKNEHLGIEIKYKKRIQAEIHISNETRISKMKKGLGIDDILSGDQTFDDALLITAPDPCYIAALLNKTAREQIHKLAINTMNLEITPGSIRINIFENDLSHDLSNALSSYVALMLSIGNSFTNGLTIKQRLLANIASETLPAVRLNNIQMLMSHFSIDKDVNQTLDGCLNNNDIETRIEAARYLKDKGMEFLVKTLKTETSLSEDLKIKIITIFRENGYNKSVPALKTLFSQKREDGSVHRELQAEIIKAFSSFGDTKLNSFLLKLLEDNISNFSLSVITALGSCGTVESVETLYTLAKKSSFPAVKNAAQNSIQQIQSRLGTAENGWLSIEELSETDGALSFSDSATEGSLSITEDENKTKKQQKE